MSEEYEVELTATVKYRKNADDSELAEWNAEQEFRFDCDGEVIEITDVSSTEVE